MEIRIGVIGNGKMAAECLKHMLTFPEVKIVFAIYQPSKDPQGAIADLGIKNNIEVKTFKKLNDSEALGYIRDTKPDYIFSINNFRIIGDELLKIPSKGIINFHNGPLPAYGGVNIPSWVILNGEKQHGVTWHFVDEGIDTGDIIIQKIFPLEDDYTAARLMTISIVEGLKLFKEFFGQVVLDKINRTPQQGEHSYFSLKQFPENNGAIDLSWSYEKISRFIRGLNFLPFNNDFVFARITKNLRSVIVNDVSKISENRDSKPGTIILLTESEFQIACEDAIISIDSMIDNDFNELTPLEASSYLQLDQGDNLLSAAAEPVNS